MSETSGKTAEAVVIKKYANRRLYNTATSTYVTLDDLSEMVKEGTDFVVYDAKSGDDITRSVLTQIIFEEESKGQNLLPIRFLRQLIRFYGDQMQAFVPSYLEMSLETLTREQEKIRDQFLGAMGVSPEPFKAIDETARRNMVMFQDAMKLFNPFAAMGGLGETPAAGARAEGQPASSAAAPGGELKALQDQIREMRRQIAAIAGGGRKTE